MGGGTTKIGDPSGKDESRKLITYEQIQDNLDSISKVSFGSSLFFCFFSSSSYYYFFTAFSLVLTYIILCGCVV